MPHPKCAWCKYGPRALVIRTGDKTKLTSCLLSDLVCFADEELPLDADGSEILSETFKILSLKEMKLQVMSKTAEGAAGEEAEEENMAMAKAVLQVARNKVVSQVKNIHQVTIQLNNWEKNQWLAQGSSS